MSLSRTLFSLLLFTTATYHLGEDTPTASPTPGSTAATLVSFDSDAI
ncbi:hypothetical protein [uncultured Duncaniella sp.]|nr:hypothetical protein [uncultured Duncaniella sp.]